MYRRKQPPRKAANAESRECVMVLSSTIPYRSICTESVCSPSARAKNNLTKNNQTLMNYKLILTTLALASAAHAGGISVGSSSLIGTIQYSDTFTIGTGAIVPARVGYGVGAYPLPFGVDAVESTYGNPARSWGSGPFSLNTDAVNLPTVSAPYPGSSGAGSDTGFTQRGGGGDWSIPYDLGSDFVVQFDYVQQPDRVDVTFGPTTSNIFGVGNLSLFIRPTATPGLPDIGIFNGSVGEFNTGLTSGIASANQWHNYAVHVNVGAKTIEVFTNEISRGILDLNTLNGGAYASFMNASSDDFVGVGGAGNDRQWSDNFQVGTSVPEPSSAALLLGGLAMLTGLRRKHA